MAHFGKLHVWWTISNDLGKFFLSFQVILQVFYCRFCRFAFAAAIGKGSLTFAVGNCRCHVQQASIYVLTRHYQFKRSGMSWLELPIYVVFWSHPYFLHTYDLMVFERRHNTLQKKNHLKYQFFAKGRGDDRSIFPQST